MEKKVIEIQLSSMSAHDVLHEVANLNVGSVWFNVTSDVIRTWLSTDYRNLISWEYLAYKIHQGRLGFISGSPIISDLVNPVAGGRIEVRDHVGNHLATLVLPESGEALSISQMSDILEAQAKAARLGQP